MIDITIEHYEVKHMQTVKHNQTNINEATEKTLETNVQKTHGKFDKQEIRSVEHGICPIAEFTSP